MQPPHHFPPADNCLPPILRSTSNKSFLCGPIGAPEIDLSLCLHDLFRRQAKLTPQKIACVQPLTASNGAQRFLTFEQLDILSDRLASFIVSKFTNGELEHTVGLYLDKSVEYVVGYVAILKAGCAYIPIELVHPREMLAQLLEEANPKLVLTSKHYSENLPSFVNYFEMNVNDVYENGAICDVSDEELEWKNQIKDMDVRVLDQVKVSPDNLAYLVFSSGTTGKPKAITCPHRGAVNSYCWRYKEYPFDEGDRVACNIFFVWELLRPMLKGATLYVIPDDTIYNPKAVVEYLSQHKINRVLFTPSLLQAVIDSHEPEELNKALASSLKIVWMCGEVLTMKLNQRFKLALPNTKVLNLYSVSECHDVSGADVADLKSDTDYASAGFMLDNVQIYILDEDFNLVDKGEIGELFVGGVTNAREYLHQPKLTAERFILNPFLEKPLVGNDNRLYRTGDIARILSDNSLEIRGRCNSMVKIRGYSIELCAVEAVLSLHESVEAAIVIPEGDDLLTKKLVAYVIGKSEFGQLDGPQLREHVKQRLPHYMVPQVIMQISEFPLNAASGKIDKKQLPKSWDRPDLILKLNNFKEAETDSEKKLLAMWHTIFGENEVIGVLDSFVDLGGNSFQMARLYAMITKEFENATSVLTLPDMYNYPTIELMARILDSNQLPITADSQPNLVAELQSVIEAANIVRRSTETAVGPFKNIFVTGVTGFLGAFLLRDILEIHKDATVHCLVRSSTTQEALQRISSHLSEFKLWNQDYESRLNIIVGNLEVEKFGLGTAGFTKLANSVDLIINNGAIVDFTTSYENMKTVNVVASKTILDLACAAESITPVIYHVSTTGVFPLLHDRKKHLIREEDIPNTPEKLKNGYSQSKWVSERLMIHARETANMPIVIFRPGDIVGDSVHGQSNKNHDLVRTIQGIIRMGAAPRDHRLIDMIPVDFVSRAIVTYNYEDSVTSGQFIYNLVHPEPVRFNDIAYALKTEIGYRHLQLLVDSKEWIDVLRTTNDLANPVVALWPFLSQIMNHDDNIYESKLFEVGGSVPSWNFLLKKMIHNLIAERKQLAAPVSHSSSPLDGKRAIITGASSGIGRAVAEKLASMGVSLVLGARSVNKLIQVQQGIQAQYPNVRVEVHQTDVTVRDQMVHLVQYTESTLGGPVDILINNAGIMPVTLMKNCKQDLWDRCIDVNIKGVLNGIAAVLPGMMERDSGDIVTISSNAGREVWDCLAVYSGSKFAVEAICKGLRKELYGTGLRVIQIQPGDVKTDLWDHDQDDPEAVERLKPLLADKILDPQDIAESIAHALSQPLHVGIHEVLIEPQGKTLNQQ